MTPNATAVRRPSAVALALSTLGVVLVLLAFTVLEWFGSSGVTSTDDGDGSSFTGVHDVLDRIRDVSASGVEARTVPVLYFGWLGWTLFAVVAVTTALATVPNPATRIGRIAAPLLALLAVAVTFVAIDLASVSVGVAEQTGSAPTYSEYLEHAGVGFYAAVVGFALAGVGARIGTREARHPSARAAD